MTRKTSRTGSAASSARRPSATKRGVKTVRPLQPAVRVPQATGKQLPAGTNAAGLAETDTAASAGSAVERKVATSPHPRQLLPGANGDDRHDQPGETSQIVIELDSAVSGGIINGRFDVQLRGRIAANVPLEALELLCNTGKAARIEYGQPHRAPPTTMPDGTPGQERAFQFNLSLGRLETAATSSFRIRATDTEGRPYEEDFALEINPAEPAPVRIAAGPNRPQLHLTGSRPPIILYVERAAIDGDGTLLLHGWTVAMNRVVTVQAFLGEDRLPAAKLGGQRDDVGLHYAAYPEAAKSGFNLAAQANRSLVQDVETVRVQAISRNGFSHEVVVPLERIPGRSRQQMTPLLPDSTADQGRAEAGLPAAKAEADSTRRPESARGENHPRDEPAREIHYFCDEAAILPDGTLRLVGWAVCHAGLSAIDITLDGEAVGSAELGFPRPDVGLEFAELPSAHLAGFRFEQAMPDIVEGPHEIRIVVRDARGDELTEDKLLHATKPIPGAPRRATFQPADPPEFRFELDIPEVVSGTVVEPVSGRLTIEGWVLARSGVSMVEVFLDSQRLGEAHYGLARQDVGAAFPDWDNALRSGYAFHCPPRALHDGEHTVKLLVHAKNGHVLERGFRLDVKKVEADDHLAGIRRRMSRVEVATLFDLLDDLGYHPHFHLLVRHGSTAEPEALQATLDALIAQTYTAWHATVLAETPGAAAHMHRWLTEHDREFAGRVSVLHGGQHAFDAPIIAPDQDAALFGVLCPGDLLGCDALGEIALAGGLHHQPEFLYADEARENPASREREPFFKPDFSPDLLLSTNYIGRPWFAKGSLLRQCAVTPRSLFARGEYDLVLRCTERARGIHHVAKLLAQRGPVALDKDKASRTALARAAKRRGFAAEVKPGCLPGTYRVQRTQRAKGKVSIIIPTCAAHGHIETCIRTLREKTAYKNYEIVCIDNIPAAEPRWKVWLQQNADQIVEIPDAFNWSRFNNIAADATDGEFLLFLNDDIEITQPDWLDALLEHVQRPEVGVVGPQLLYPGDKVQHAGMFLGTSVGRHAFRFAPHDEPGYFGLALTQRNVIAVTGACMLMRRSFFEAMNGFEEAHSVINNDLDFCLRAHQAGKLTVFTPYASLVHHELASRDRIGDTFDTTHFDSRWRTTFAAGDPYFSPRLARNSDDYRPDDEAAQTVFPAHPLFERSEIQRILVMKLDHIGDVITALPAIRRLKALFPQASVTMLAGRSARSVTALEPAIDAFIEFDFFHARSQLGEKTLTKDDFEALRQQLAPHRFDLAIDLRKHLSTRDVLRYTGARFLAGYNYAGRFPFLDIALEWEGDKTLERKRTHVVDDLLSLVEAVNSATLSCREMLPTPPAPIPLEALPGPVQALFEQPVVAIHAGAGNVTKQWPEAYFAALIELLLERDRVNVLLVGGPDDQTLSDGIVQRVQRPERIASIAGGVKLDDLAGLLVRCRLFIGNDSGPKHIAAMVGVPTIGIHSGVVDAVEWGPVGRRAVALQRNMSCSPCYLAHAEDCPRGLACLHALEPAIVHKAVQTLLARPIAAPAVQTVTESPARPVYAAPAKVAGDSSGSRIPARKKNGLAETKPTARVRLKFKPNRQGAPA